MNLSMEQRLLVYAISYDYILLNDDSEMGDDVKKALCGAFIANKIDYRPCDLVRDIAYLEQMRLIEKDRKEKRYITTFTAEQKSGVVINDEKKENQNVLPVYNLFMSTFWTLFCSFIKAPIGEFLRNIEQSKARNISDLRIESDIVSAILYDLAVKRGLIVRDANGCIFLTDSGRKMLASSA